MHLKLLTAYFEAKSSNPDDALKIIYGLYESVHDVNKEISVQKWLTFLRKSNFCEVKFVKTDWKCIFVCVFFMSITVK